MSHISTVTAFAIALLPAPALAQLEPASGPVPTEDLTPYAGTYTIVSPGVAKTNYMDVLKGHLQADGNPFGSRDDARNRLASELDRLEANPHDTVVNNRNGHTWVVSAPTAAAEGEPHGLFVFISPRDQGTVPDNWQETLEKNRLIWVGPNGEPGLHPLACGGRARVGGAGDTAVHNRSGSHLHLGPFRWRPRGKHSGVLSSRPFHRRGLLCGDELV